MSDSKKSFLDEESHGSEGAGGMRWLLTYADMITLLLGLFIVLVSSRVVDQAKYDLLVTSAAKVFGAGNSMILRAEGKSMAVKGGGRILPYFGPTEEQQARKPGGVGIQETSMGTRITLDETKGIAFDSGSSGLNAKVIATLDWIYDAYLNGSRTSIVIKGHTDDQPISTAVFPSNWELSSGRAGSVARYYMDKKGISPHRITTAGYADTDPVADNSTAEGRSRNRRVEIWLLKGPVDRLMRKAGTVTNTSQPGQIRESAEETAEPTDAEQH